MMIRLAHATAGSGRGWNGLPVKIYLKGKDQKAGQKQLIKYSFSWKNCGNNQLPGDSLLQNLRPSLIALSSVRTCSVSFLVFEHLAAFRALIGFVYAEKDPNHVQLLSKVKRKPSDRPARHQSNVTACRMRNPKWFVHQYISQINKPQARTSLICYSLAHA